MELLIIFVIAILVLIIIYLYLISPGKINRDKVSWMFDYYYAHRGLFSKDQSIPENSLLAFRKAVDYNFGIELDVNMTSDGVLVVFHDDNLKRMTSIDKLIINCTYDEIKNLRLKDSTETIPTFDDVLKLVNGYVPLIIELKHNPNRNLLCKKVYERLRTYNGLYCIESFDPLEVKWFKDNAPHIFRGQLSMNYSNSKNPLLLNISLEYLLTNFLSKPQFIAYRYTDCNNISYRIIKNWGAITVGWTLENDRVFNKNFEDFDAVIFEHCDELVKKSIAL